LGLEDINASSDEDYQRQEENIRQQHSKNIEIAKQQIAQDLELPLENIIYIPQFDFHIDMWFRPLQDGVIATPDFDSAIHILTDLLATEQFTPEEKTELETLKQGLETMNTTTAPFI
jgi:hypothetical protein